MKKAIITVGCSASGKSTFALDLVSDFKSGWVELNRDNYRKLILCIKFEDYNVNHDSINMWSLWNFKWEDSVTEMFEKGLEANIGNNIIISDTNLNKGKRDLLIKRLEGLGYEVEVKVFGQELTIDELWKRDERRLDTVGRDVIARQYYQFRKEFPKYQIKKVDGNPCVIFDVDGTLTLGPENRSAYEWDKVSQDLPRLNLFNTMVALKNEGYKIIVLSGRDSVCRKDTLKWLERWYSYLDNMSHDFTNFPQIELYMRPENDMRSDIDVKLELFFNHIDGKYNVCAVYDDRPKVIRNVWLELGFDTYCVGNQYLEF